MGKNKPYDALLQGSNRNYGTGIRTTDIRQAEFDSGEWKTVLGEFRMIFHIDIVDLQRDTARNPEWLMRVFILFLPATSRTK